MITAKELILKRLNDSIIPWFTPEEMAIEGYSINNICTRLAEMVKEGKLVARFRDGKNYKEWGLVAKKKEPDNTQENDARTYDKCSNLAPIEVKEVEVREDTPKIGIGQMELF